MEEPKEITWAEGPRIRYAADPESATADLPRLARHASTTSQMSVQSVRSATRRRGSIDPASALPVQYRTLSVQIEETRDRDLKEVQKGKDHAVVELADLEWHTLSIEKLLQRWSTSLSQGLSAEQVTRRVAEYGRNLPSRPGSDLPRRIFEYLFGGFGSILFTASILVFISWKPLGKPPQAANLALAIVLLVVFLVQAGFNAWQDWSSSRVMASINTMLPENCLVLRDGVQRQIVAEEIVPGDVLYVKAGNKLPADVRFVEVSSDAKFDRSILTGESLPVSGSVDSTDDNYLETHCIGMQGTHCISGSALGVCVATGDRTVFGRIAKLTNRPKSGLTTLQKEIYRFVLIIVSFMVAVILLVIVLWAAWLRKSHASWINVPTLIVDLVSVAVAFVPEGLPVAVTASLTITANTMRRNKILCKSLKTVETLGSVSVICSDKTGTLTRNQMFVTDACIAHQTMTPETARDLVTLGPNTREGAPSGRAVQQLRALAGLCNAGEFDATTAALPLHERVINGDATDQAVLRFSETLGPVSSLRLMWKKVFDMAFNSKNKFMIRVLAPVDAAGLAVALPVREAEDFADGDLLLTIKGAPDVLMPRCDFYTGLDGATHALDATMRAAMDELKDTWSAQGKRVILLARKTIPTGTIPYAPTSVEYERAVMGLAKADLVLIGIVGIVDPPREEIPEVVRILRRAGIRIFMITGDFKLTAQAIAQECGIFTNPSHLVDDISVLQRTAPAPAPVAPVAAEKTETAGTTELAETAVAPTRVKSIVLSGPELITLNDVQWNQLCQYEEIVFARTTPEQKLRIVKEFQAHDNVVGMTGDGVNDAPSLKAADIGIALGSGSDIAIEAADMVLLDSFSAIVEAVKYGRVVFDNLKKTIGYMLPAGTFSELWPVLTSVFFGLPQILSSFLMIIICCFTDCAAATALSYEQPEADVLLRRPRNVKKDRLVDWRLILQFYGFFGTIETLTSFAMSYWYAQRRGVPFSALWLKYGELPPGYDQKYVTGVLNEASSIYFVNLVVMQWFTLMAVRTRRLSIFQQPPLFNKRTRNLYLFPAILFALLIVFFFCYIPSLQKVLNSTRVPVEHFFLPMAFGMCILILDEARKYAVRRWPTGFLGRVAW
ncbi:MAG: hypothetical protein M1826_002406 [Phylliscum demangeonii]|nr:MAG: hypothetical protein M1826_002406 [Phylliscum demangeonii]